MSECVDEWVSECMHACVCVCMHTFVHVCVHRYVCMHTCACVCVLQLQCNCTTLQSHPIMRLLGIVGGLDFSKETATRYWA